MFTGLVEAMGTLAATTAEGAGRRLRLRLPEGFRVDPVGSSVALNGCCLTVVNIAGNEAEFQAGPETLQRTNLGQLAVGAPVNLERALPANGRLGGHLVQGHIDGTGTLVRRERTGEWESFWFDAGPLTHGMIPKGSVAVDGVSLTLVDVSGPLFSVALIPHTLTATTLGLRRKGDLVNLETDLIGKYVMKFLQGMQGGLTLERLRAAGMAP